MNTESEARTKWCPFARASGGEDAASNRTETTGKDVNSAGWNWPAYRCVASDCMAWRDETVPVRSEHQPPSEWIDEPTGQGYCGLAGKP